MAALPIPGDPISLAIDEAFVRAAREGDSMGIGMSEVVHPCTRYLWYKLRWATDPEPATGQRQRRFATGEAYEQRMLDALRMIGADVTQVDDATGKQIRVELARGHLRGKLDGVATSLPVGPTIATAIECKTSNDKSYKAITKGPIKETKPEHYAQIQLYMHALGLQRGLYMLVNKNTDDLHTEFVEYDPQLCLSIIARIEMVVSLDAPPPKLHEDPGAKGARECGWCPARDVCHYGHFARSNCRTCSFSTAQDGPKWLCELHDKHLSYDEMQAGCADHRYLPGCVPGEQIDADQDGYLITYRLLDGSEWVDGRAA